MKHSSLVVLTVVMILMVLSPSCNFLREKGLIGKKKALAEMMAVRDSIRAADSIRLVNEKLEAIENAKLDSLRKVEEERLALEAKFKYNLIVGSFLTPEYAKELSEEYRKQGYDPQIIKVDDSKFEFVAAEAHNSFIKAVARLREFQDTVQIDTWLYIKR